MTIKEFIKAMVLGLGIPALGYALLFSLTLYLMAHHYE